MLYRFSVENFKNFKKRIDLDLSDSKNYAFNKEAVRDGIVKTSIIVGPNASGKSNLSLAIFDIIGQVTDKNTTAKRYQNYTFGNNGDPVRFSYWFQIEGSIIQYEYVKLDHETLVYERLTIRDRVVLLFDREDGTVLIDLEGAEMLDKQILNKNLSILKYVRRNTNLKDTVENRLFHAMYDFIDHMLSFRSLDGNEYQGYDVGSGKITEGILKKGKLKEFEAFLKTAHIDCVLRETRTDTNRDIVFCFGNREIPFFDIASTGTRALALFYHWYLDVQEHVSFLLIDEFDAFYHFELAQSIVAVLRSLGKTQVILTTHNTDLISNDLLRPDCYFELQEDRIVPFWRNTNKEIRQAHNMQKIYKAGGFNGK